MIKIRKKDNTLYAKIINTNHTPKSFAKKIKKSDRTVARLLGGECIGPKTANTICKVLKCDFDDIFITLEGNNGR